MNPPLKIRIEGLRELDARLGEMPKATARNVLRRVLARAGEPIAEAARALVPVGERPRFDENGKQLKHLKDTIAVSPRLGTKAGSAEYRAALRRGEGKEAAVSALRDARREAAGAGSFAEMYVGPGTQPHAHLVEFGSVNNPPHPYMRPAWEANKDRALEIIKTDLGKEVDRAAQRLARKAAKAGR